MAYPFDHPMFAKSIQPTDQASTISRSEQLHQWSIYRQQLNAALTQSALTAGCLPSSDVTSGRPFDLKSKHARKPPIETAANQLSVDALDYFHLALPRVRAPSSGDLYRSVTSSRTSSSKSHTLRHHYNPHSHLQHLPPHLQAPSRYQQQDARKQHHVSSSSFSSASSSSNRRSMHPLLHPHHPHHHPHHHLQQKQLFLLPPAQDFQQSYVREHNLHYNHHLQLSSASSSHLIRHSEQQLPDLHLNTRTDPFPTAELNCELKSGGQASANDTNCDSERNNSLHPSTLPHSASKQELVRANRNNEKANSSKVTLAQLIDSKSQQSENEMPKHGEPKRLLEKSCLNNRHTLISARLRRSMLDLGTTDDRKAPEFKHQRALSVDELRSRPIDASCQPINTLRSDSTAQPSVASSESGPNQTTIDSEYHRTPLTSEQSSLKRLGSVFSEEIDGSGGPLLSSNPSFDKSSNSGTQLESVTCNSSAIDCSRAKQYKTQLLVRSMYFEYDCTSNPGLLCGGARQKVRVLDHINFELLAGQMILLMATNELEGRSVLDVLSGQQSRTRTQTRTHILLNGQPIESGSQLTHLISYVNANGVLCPDLSVRHTLWFHWMLTGKRSSSARPQIDQLLHDINLHALRHTSVRHLNSSELVRLRLAIALLLDPPILLIDLSTCHHDMAETIFILQYVRQWTRANDRMTMVLMHPANQEQLLSFDVVFLLSTGRFAYKGPADRMQSHFAKFNYSSPPYTNPMDFLADLLTPDASGQSAMYESNVRIEQLLTIESKQDTIPRPFHSSDPWPEPIPRRSFLLTCLVLWLRSLLFMFPYNMIRLMQRVTLALLLSLACGLVFYQIRDGHEQEHLWDRVALYHVLLFLFPLPILLLEMHNVYKEKLFAISDMQAKLYGRFAYMICDLVYTAPVATLSFATFAYPACTLAGPKANIHVFLWLLIGYLHTMRLMAIVTCWFCKHKSKALIVFLILYVLLLSTAGISLHAASLNMFGRTLSVMSPAAWTVQSLLHWEFGSAPSSSLESNVRFACSSNPLVQHANAIVSRADCGIVLPEHLYSFLRMVSPQATDWTHALHIQFTSMLMLLVIWFIRLQTLDFNCTEFVPKSKTPLLQKKAKSLPKEVI